jgi:PPOX class probable F420-dependent enzyme
MTHEERIEFLRSNKTIVIATVGLDGRPHLAPLWYDVHDDGVLTVWTRAVLQKVRNLERKAEATALVEDGHNFSDIRGVSMKCSVEIVRDPQRVGEIGHDIMTRYLGQGDAERDAFVEAQAAVRVGLVLTPTSIVSWDHTKQTRR